MRSQLDLLTPPELISTHQFASSHRMLLGLNGAMVRWNPESAPYAKGVHDALDDPAKPIVAVIGAARTIKTTMLENHLLKRVQYGPSGNFAMYMQSKEDVDDYVDERVDPLYDLHPAVAAKVSQKKLGRRRRRVGGYLHSYLPASPSTTRGKAAVLVGADEIDGYARSVRNSILTRLRNRQREFGRNAKLYLCSHPDLAPNEGIYPIYWDSDRRLWYWKCLACGSPASPSDSADLHFKLHMPQPDGMPDDEVLDYVAENARIVCPHCGVMFGDTERLEMNRAGFWVGRGQVLSMDSTVAGDLIPHETAGFWLDGLMSTHPNNSIGRLAREYVAASIKAKTTGREDELREVVVKSLGRVMYGSGVRAKPRVEADLKARNIDPDHGVRTVPEDAWYLIASVDIQGDRFEVAIWAFGRNFETWLVDRFAIRAWDEQQIDRLRPAEVASHWHVLYERVLMRTYPLASDPDWHLPIARMVIDTGGGKGQEGEDETSSTTMNARLFGSWLRSSKLVPDWRFALIKGSPNDKSEMIGTKRAVNRDEHGKIIDPKVEAALGGVQVYETTINVSSLKNIAAFRLAVEEPGPGFVHLPYQVDVKGQGLGYILAELTAEVYVGGQWVKRHRRNETWDLLVYGIAGAFMMTPDAEDRIWYPVEQRPIWARRIRATDTPRNEDQQPAKRLSVYDRYAALQGNS